jgi:hypothetical protein
MRPAPQIELRISWRAPIRRNGAALPLCNAYSATPARAKSTKRPVHDREPTNNQDEKEGKKAGGKQHLLHTSPKRAEI